MCHFHILSSLSFFTAPATTEIYTLSLHDALPISRAQQRGFSREPPDLLKTNPPDAHIQRTVLRESDPHCVFRFPESVGRSEEHTSELQSHSDLVCRLLLEKKKKQKK